MVTGVYLEGCCDDLTIDVDVYLREVAQAILGDEKGDSGTSTESIVSDYIPNKDNHDNFANGYQTDFAGDVWNWLKERSILVKTYFNNGGNSWTRRGN